MRCEGKIKRLQLNIGNATFKFSIPRDFRHGACRIDDPKTEESVHYNAGSLMYYVHAGRAEINSKEFAKYVALRTKYKTGTKGTRTSTFVRR